MLEQRRSGTVPASLAAGAIIGVTEGLLAVSFAAVVFGGRIVGNLPAAIALYLVAASATLWVFAWRAGSRGIAGGLQAPAAAALSVVAAGTALNTFGSVDRASLTVIAATMVVTLLCAAAFVVLGWRRLANVLRFVPYPVLGGLLAGTGWLLLERGVYVASAVLPDVTPIADLLGAPALQLWVPAVAFGVVIFVATRLVKHPLVVPVALAVGVALFATGVVITGSSIETARSTDWLLLTPFDEAASWEPLTLRALTGADWLAVLGQWAAIAASVFVVVVAISFNLGGTELVLRRDLDTNRELRDAGLLNGVLGAGGGIPGYHALGSTGLAERMGADARVAGIVAGAVPLAVVLAGAPLIELIPRAIVAALLVYIGLAAIVEWVWDRRRSLTPLEYGVMLLIIVAIAVLGFLPGVVVGLVLAVVLFAVSYGRIELVREVAFGESYQSNVDRPPGERAALRAMADRVQILRVNGFVFFGSASGLLERVRRRVEGGRLRFLVIDLRRVTGVDASAVVSFGKVVHLARANGIEVALADASDAVRRQLARGGVTPIDGVVTFQPDIDRALQRCEDLLLDEASADLEAIVSDDGATAALAEMPAALRSHLERVSLAEGTVLLRQGEPPADVFLLDEGRLSVEMITAGGTRVRLRTLLPGVVVGEVAMYTRVPRTADVIAEAPSVVLRLGGEAIERIEAEDAELAASVHRWLATTLSQRLSESVRRFDALLG